MYYIIITSLKKKQCLSGKNIDDLALGYQAVFKRETIRANSVAAVCSSPVTYRTFLEKVGIVIYSFSPSF